MEQIKADEKLVAYCGLYCGACGSHRKGRCPGCHENHKASWCAVRRCCINHRYSSCAQCTEYTDPKACAKYNNFIAKVFGFVFRSDRAACIQQIRDIGLNGHASAMAQSGRQSIRR